MVTCPLCDAKQTLVICSKNQMTACLQFCNLLKGAAHGDDIWVDVHRTDVRQEVFDLFNKGQGQALVRDWDKIRLFFSWPSLIGLDMLFFIYTHRDCIPGL